MGMDEVPIERLDKKKIIIIISFLIEGRLERFILNTFLKFFQKAQGRVDTETHARHFVGNLCQVLPFVPSIFLCLWSSCCVLSSTALHSRQSTEGHIYLKYSVTWLIFEDASGRGLWSRSLGTVLSRGQTDACVVRHGCCSHWRWARNMSLPRLSLSSL